MSEEPTTKPRMNPQDYRNQELVSRLLAATPPYLYSAPVGPHNFFFSEMLRSIVQAKNNEATVTSRNSQLNHQPQPQMGRRPRKRSWSNHRTPSYEQPKQQAEEKPVIPEKPLELTNKHNEFSLSPKGNHDTQKILSPRIDESVKIQRIDVEEPKTPESTPPILTPTSETPSTSSIPPSDLILPPPPPMWYPPIYPPYGIDPLHFFIDLRVSGHIYDRKKENTSPSYRPENNNSSFFDAESISKCRQNSAFSVPIPKDTSAINLITSDKKEPSEPFFDFFDTKEKVEISKNTNYVMQNLPRIYTNLATSHCGDDVKTEMKYDPRDEDNLSGENLILKRQRDEEDETIAIE